MTWWFWLSSESALTTGTNDTGFEKQREFFYSSQVEVMSASNRRMRSGAYPLLVPGRGQSSEECTNRDLTEPKLVIAFVEKATCWEEAHAEKSRYTPNLHLTVKEFQTLDKHSKTKPLEFWEVNVLNGKDFGHAEIIPAHCFVAFFCKPPYNGNKTTPSARLLKTILYHLMWKTPSC